MQNTLNSFIESKIESIQQAYPWEVNHAYLPGQIELDAGTNFGDNIQLKLRLHELYLGSAPDMQLEIITYYISKWGGVRTNKPETMKYYATEPIENIIRERRIKGIASWSKALCVRDPRTYAIFDARVSASLNLLQLTHLEPGQRVWFPRLSTRNNTIREINALVRAEGGTYHSKETVYSDYLTLIRNAAEALNTDIQTVEMILFTYPFELFVAYQR